MTDDEFLDDFRIAFDELNSAPDKRILFFYSLAQNQMSQKYWANLYKEGVLNLTAHFLTMKYGLDGNSTKPNLTVQQEVTSKTIGKLSKGMSSKNSSTYANAGDYALTTYGRRYWELSQLVRPTGMVVGGRLGLAGTFTR